MLLNFSKFWNIAWVTAYAAAGSSLLVVTSVALTPKVRVSELAPL